MLMPIIQHCIQTNSNVTITTNSIWMLLSWLFGPKMLLRKGLPYSTFTILEAPRHPTELSPHATHHNAASSIITTNTRQDHKTATNQSTP